MSKKTIEKYHQVMTRNWSNTKDVPAHERWSSAPESFPSIELAEDWIQSTLLSIPKDGPDAPLVWVRTYYQLSKS